MAKNSKFEGIPKPMIQNGQVRGFLPRKALIRRNEPLNSD
jgi:hypothetical protein